MTAQTWATLRAAAARAEGADAWTDLRRRVPLRPQTDGCRDDALRNGTCYCAKVRTAEADAELCARGAKPAAVIVGGSR